MSQQKARPYRALVVLDFRCDKCDKMLDVIVVAESRAMAKLRKSYCMSCWRLVQTEGQVQLAETN